MRTRIIGSALLAALAFFAAIFIGREWLLTGGGDLPAFTAWTVLCFAAGFALASKLASAELDKQIDKKLKERTATVEDIMAVFEEE